MEAILSETPTVSLKDFIDGLQLTDDPEDAALIMQALHFNRIKVGDLFVAYGVRFCCDCFVRISAPWPTCRSMISIGPKTTLVDSKG